MLKSQREAAIERLRQRMAFAAAEYRKMDQHRITEAAYRKKADQELEEAQNRVQEKLDALNAILRDRQ